MTVQGETYTIKELMLRAVANGTILESSEGVYIDASLEEINKFYKPSMDLTDYEELKTHITDLQKKIEKNQQIETQNKLHQEVETKRLEKQDALNAVKEQNKQTIANVPTP